MSTGYKKLLKYTQVEEIECLKKTGLQDLRALLDTEDGKQFLQAVEVLDRQTQKPSKAQLEKAVGAHVDFQVEHTSELQKTLAQVYQGAMQNLEQLLVEEAHGGSAQGHEEVDLITGRRGQVQVSAPGRLTKVSKNKKPKSKRKDSSDESSDDGRRRGDRRGDRRGVQWLLRRR